MRVHTLVTCVHTNGTIRMYHTEEEEEEEGQPYHTSSYSNQQ